MRPHIFSLCPDSTVRTSNSGIALRKEEFLLRPTKWEFPFCAGQFRNCTDSHFVLNTSIYENENIQQFGI